MSAATAPRPLGTLLSASLFVVAALMPFAGQDVAIAAWCAAALAANLHARIRLEDLVVPVPLLVLLVWIAASVSWSVAPVGTGQGAVQSALLVVGGAAVAARRTVEDLLEVVALALKVLLGLSWLIGLALPAYGRTQDAYQAGSLEGAFAHRNLLAYVMVVAVVTFVVRALAARGPARAGSAGWTLAAVATVVATRSSTALLVAAAAGAVGLALLVVLVLRPGLRRVIAVPLLAGAGFLVWFATANLDTVARSVGRDPTLTGRTDIWSVVLHAVADRPVQGYGWSALWHAGTPVTERMWAQGGFAFFHAHDGYLDMALQVGAIGLLLHLLVVAGVLRGSARGYLAAPSPVRAWPLLVLAVVLAYNVSETVLPVNIGWLLVAALSSCCARAVLERPGPRPTPAHPRGDQKVLTRS